MIKYTEVSWCAVRNVCLEKSKDMAGLHFAVVPKVRTQSVTKGYLNQSCDLEVAPAISTEDRL